MLSTTRLVCGQQSGPETTADLQLSLDNFSVSPPPPSLPNGHQDQTYCRQFSDNLDEIYDAIVTYEQHIQLIDVQLNRLAENKRSVEERILKRAEEMKAVIEAHSRHLLTELNSMIGSARKQFEDHRQNVTSALAIFEAYRLLMTSLKMGEDEDRINQLSQDLQTQANSTQINNTSEEFGVDVCIINKNIAFISSEIVENPHIWRAEGDDFNVIGRLELVPCDDSPKETKSTYFCSDRDLSRSNTFDTVNLMDLSTQDLQHSSEETAMLSTSMTNEVIGRVRDSPSINMFEEITLICNKSIITNDNVSVMDVFEGLAKVNNQLPNCAMLDLNSNSSNYGNPIVIGKLNGDKILCGVAALCEKVYVVRHLSSLVEVFNSQTMNQVGVLFLDGLRDPVDIGACPEHHCLYISGSEDSAVYQFRPKLHKRNVENRIVPTKWPMKDKPFGLSVDRRNNNHLLVTFNEAGKLREYSSDGTCLRELDLSDEISSPWHAVHHGDGEQFIVCHGWMKDRLNRVCLVDDEDGRVRCSYGGVRSTSTGSMDLPTHLALDSSGMAFVADLNNDRIHVLQAGSDRLEPMGYLLVSEELKWPRSICLDETRQRLYVGLHDGPVLVFEFRSSKHS